MGEIVGVPLEGDIEGRFVTTISSVGLPVGLSVGEDVGMTIVGLNVGTHVMDDNTACLYDNVPEVTVGASSAPKNPEASPIIFRVEENRPKLM